MTEVIRLSIRYRVVIPKGISERFKLEKGDELIVSLLGET